MYKRNKSIVFPTIFNRCNSCYISALVLTCFRLAKGRASFFRPETIVTSFLHLMVSSFKVLLNHKSLVCGAFLLHTNIIIVLFWIICILKHFGTLLIVHSPPCIPFSQSNHQYSRYNHGGSFAFTLTFFFLNSPEDGVKCQRSSILFYF